MAARWWREKTHQLSSIATFVAKFEVIKSSDNLIIQGELIIYWYRLSQELLRSMFYLNFFYSTPLCHSGSGSEKCDRACVPSRRKRVITIYDKYDREPPW